MNILINEKMYWLEDINSFTVLQFCYKNFIENIPRFCYHEKLMVAGNCRMCLIEDSKSLKPVVSCTVIITNNSCFYTETLRVKKAREAMLEFLLINHPLDCPICCQGGECDLQDLTESFGADKGRYYENKRAVTNKNLGPIIKTLMNRCIHCTRCIRFSVEVGDIHNLGLLGRGTMMEVGTYLDTFVFSEFSGNLVDICPVGALTSKPYSYISRPWELESYIVPNLYDIFLTDLRFDVRGGSILRILPVYSMLMNHEWITDSVRYFFDSLKVQRLSMPVIFLKKYLFTCSWVNIFYVIRHFFINVLEWIFFNKFKYVTCIFKVGPIVSIKLALMVKFIQNIFMLDHSKYHFNGDHILDYDALTQTFLLSKNLFILMKDFRTNYPGLYLKVKELSQFYDYKWFSFNIYNTKALSILYKNLFYFFEGKSSFSSTLVKSGFIFEYAYIKYIKDALIYLQQYFVFSTGFYELPPVLSNIIKNQLSLKEEGPIFEGVVPCLLYNIGCDNFEKMFFINKNLCIYQGFIGDIGVQYSTILLPTPFYYEHVASNTLTTYLDWMGYTKVLYPVLMSPSNVKSGEEIIFTFCIFLEIFFDVEKQNYDFIFCKSEVLFKTPIFMYCTMYESLLNIMFFRNNLFTNSRVLQVVNGLRVISTWEV